MTDSQKLDFLLQKMNQIDTKVDKLDTQTVQFNSWMDKLNYQMDQFHSRMDQLDNRMDQFHSRMDRFEERVAGIELHLENETDKSIQLLAENHIELINKLNQAIPAADKSLAYEVKVNYLIGEVNKLKEEVDVIKSKSA